MTNCNPCNKSILSQTPYKIGETQCTQPCPPEITCVDIIPSNCVFYSGPTLSCPSGSTSVDYGVTITEALNTMYQLICQNSTSCTVAVTASDTSCCGYLGDSSLPVNNQGVKIKSQTLNINVQGGSCQYLSIEEKCWNFKRVGQPGNSPFKNGWTNAAGFFPYEYVGYSDVKECSVKLRGAAYKIGYNTASTLITKTIFTLPATHAPQRLRRFLVGISVYTQSSPNQTVGAGGFILISPSGDVQLLVYSSNINGDQVIDVSLDGIEFEIN